MAGTAHRRQGNGFRAIGALILREMSTTYGRSPGGYLWAVLEPVGAVMLMSVIFSFAFRQPPIGTSFALFYATGLLPLMIYTDLTAKLGQSIRFSRPLLAYPNVTLFDALLGRIVLNVLTHLVIFIIVMSGLVTLLDVHVILDHGAIAHALAMAIAFGVSIGVLNCFLMSRFPVWMRIWAIANRPMFVISGVFFLVDEVPEPFRGILMFNPLAHAISEMRAGFYVTYDAVLVSPLYVYMVSIVITFFGVLLLHSFGRRLLDEGA